MGEWDGTLLAGALLLTALTGGGNAAYFAARVGRPGRPAARLGTQVLALVNTGAALQAGLRLTELLRAAPVADSAWFLAQSLTAGAAATTSILIVRRVAAAKGRER